VEIGGLPVSPPDSAPPAIQPADATQPGARPYLRIYFRCAGTYARAYLHPDGTRYLAQCAKCGQTCKFVIGEGGTNQRFFEMSCT
jgi:hypothetical protein